MAEPTREQAAALADAICSTAIMNVTLRDFFAAFALAGLISQSDQSMPRRKLTIALIQCWPNVNRSNGNG